MAGMKQVVRLSWGISNNGYHNNKENGRNDNNSNITMTKSDNSSTQVVNLFIEQILL
jgi:hypothetical protein